MTPLGELGGGAVVTHTEITDSYRAEQAMRQAGAAAGLLADEPGAFALLDRHGSLLFAGSEAQELVGSAGGAGPLERVHGRDRDALRSAFQEVVRTGEERRLTVRALREPGCWALLELRITNLLDREEVGAVVVAGREVLAARRAALSAQLDSKLLDKLPVGVLVADDAGVVAYANERAAELVGRSVGDVMGRDVEAVLPDPSSTRRRHVESILLRDGRWEGEGEAVHDDGTSHPIYLVLELVEFPEIDFRGSIVTIAADGDRRALRASLEHRQLYDEITGLPRRPLLLDRIQHALDRRRTHRPLVAVLLVELEHFWSVVNLAGHEQGEVLLRSVADLLSSVAGTGHTVARLEATQFAVCWDGLDDELAAVGIAERLQAALSQPFRVDGRTITVSVSVGIATATGGGWADAGRLLGDADVALRRGQERGGGHIEVFAVPMRDALDRRVKLAEDLAAAVAEDQLQLLYQAVVDLDGGGVVGAEALVRWDHPELGRLSADEFIPLAESTNRINEVGRWVIEHAVREAARWTSQLPERRLGVSVNLSGRQLGDPLLLGCIEAALDEHGLDPALLCLEVTESALMADPVSGGECLRRLRQLGVHIAVDDFGTGVSSLGRLKELPIDRLKIDRSFVASMDRDPEDAVIVRAVSQLARALGIEPIAEGVEAREHVGMLRAAGCHLGQGFLWSAPVEGERFLELARDRYEVVPAITEGAAARQQSSDDLVSILRHELVSPLAVVAGAFETLEDLPQDDQARRVLALGARSASRIGSFLDTLEDVRLIDSGRVVLRRRTVDAAVLVSGVVEAFRVARPHRPIAHGALPSALLSGDQDRLEQILHNLLQNADRFSPTGLPIEVGLQVHHAAIEVHVDDLGAGIPSDRVADAFRKFGQVERRGTGSGLGLFIARQLARAHGGDVQYRRRAGAGSRFILTLPRLVEDA